MSHEYSPIHIRLLTLNLLYMNQRLRRLFSLMFSVSVMQFLLAQVVINDVNFPDKLFRDHVSTNYDLDKNDTLSTTEIEKVDTIDVSLRYTGNKDNMMTDLTGIEYFTALKKLGCSYHALTSIDISKNTELTELRCDRNSLTSLNVTENKALRVLHCDLNEIEYLDVSKNTELEELWCGSNMLITLNVSKNLALTELDCPRNWLLNLNLTNNVKLKSLNCGRNMLSSLDVSKNIELESLLCWQNQLTSLLLPNSTALKTISCWTNNLTSLDVSKNTALEYLLCYWNPLTSLDVSNNTALIEFECKSNQLTTLDVTKNTKLEVLDCSENQLTSLDLSNNTLLKRLACSSNNLSSLDLSNNTLLKRLYCSSNNLSSLDLSNNLNLNPTMSWYVDCSDNFYTVNIDKTFIFNLSSLPGEFDHTRMTIKSGNAVDKDGLLKVDESIGEDTIKVVYEYIANKDYTFEYTLNLVPVEVDDVPLVNSVDAFSFYPNPAKSSVSVLSTGYYKIYDGSGVLLQSGMAEKDDEINISNLSPGVYLFDFEGRIEKLFVK